MVPKILVGLTNRLGVVPAIFERFVADVRCCKLDSRSRIPMERRTTEWSFGKLVDRRRLAMELGRHYATSYGSRISADSNIAHLHLICAK
jgi:hypothetical protein